MIITVIDIKTRREYQIDARSNGENAVKCPVCADDRKKKSVKSMTFNAQKQVGHCHHCDARFIEKGAGSSQMRPEPKVYTRPIWSNVTKLSDGLVQWFKSRGISQQTIMDLKITEGKEWMPQVQKEMNCVKFNYFRGDELVNVKYRDGLKNFKLVAGAELILYNLNAIQGREEVILVEGEVDAASMHEVCLTGVLSVPNGASKGGKLEYMDNCWSFFEDVKVIYIGTDNDEPGRALRDELARRLGKERCKIIDYGKFKDANEVLQADPLLLPEMVKDATWYPIEGIFEIKSQRQDVLDMKKNGLKPGENISIEAINRHITWVPGYVTGITGVPNHGKGEFLDQIIVDLAHFHGWPFGIYSPENYPLSLHISKFASKVTGEAFNAMPDSALNQFMDEYNDLLYFIMPPEDLTLDSILDSAAILVKKNGIKGLVIDPWNKLDHQFTGPETQYISQCLDKVDLFARKHGVHVFLVVHPAKLHKDKETGKVEVPTPYSISGSAHWYNKLANCLTVYRNFYDDGTSTTDIHIQKVKFKHWGGQGVVNLSYNPFSGRYYTVGFENRQSYLHAPVQAALPLNIKPNVDFTVPKKDQWEDEVKFESTDEIPF